MLLTHSDMNIMFINKILISLETLGELLGLPQETVSQILKQKPIHFDYKTNIAYQNFDENYNVILDNTVESQILNKPSDELFQITVKNTLFEIKGNNIPAVFLFKKTNWENILDREPYYIQKFKMLALIDDDRKIFLGENSTLERLSEQFPNRCAIMEIQQLLGAKNGT